MTTIQRTVVAMSLMVVFLMILVPPWKGGDYALIFGPHNLNEIDFKRLLVQLALVATAGYALLIIGKPTTVQDAQETPQPGRSSVVPMLLCAGAFILLFGTAVGWHWLSQFFQAQQSQAMQEAQLRATREAAEAQQKSRAAAEEYERTLQQDAQAQEEARLNKLATPKTWSLVGRPIPNIRASARTYWKNGLLYLQLRLNGSASDLEYGIDKHPTFHLELIDQDGLTVQAMEISPSTFEPQRNKGGAITSYVSANQTIAMEDALYNTIASVKLTN